jgi:plastocyanin
MKRSILISTAIISLTGCASPKAPASTHAYVPRIREITITTVPLLVREQVSTFPFLAKDFGKGGVLEGKEVYAFSPSTVTVVEGDTIQFTLINPEDDDHSFALPDLVVPLPPQQTARVTYIAKHAGIYPILCTIPKHLPMMSGQFIVLAGTSMAD